VKDTARSSDDLEGQIGKLWFNRIGIFALLSGGTYFLKYAFDNGWIGPAGQVAIGLVSGILLLLWSERFRNKGNKAFSYSLKAVGLGFLYLSFWAASKYYHPALISTSLAFPAMALVTATTVILALTQDAEVLAVYAMIGGFCTPALLSTGENHEVVLFSYVALLDLAIVAMVAVRPWRRLVWGSFLGTGVLYMGWSSEYYSSDQRTTTILFASLFFAIFAVVPLLTPLTQSRWHHGFSVTLTALPLVNAAAFFLALYVMYENETATLTWFALALSAIYLGLNVQLRRRADSEPEVLNLLTLLHVAIAIAFATIAIPLKLNQHWITIGWLIEAAVLLWVAVRARADFLRYFAALILALGIFRLLAYDKFHTTTLVFNARFATYMVAISIMAGIVVAGARFASEHEKPFLKFADVALNMLALIALSLEAHDFFARQMSAFYANNQTINTIGPFQQIEFARNFSYSAIWLLYGAGLMTFGFWKHLSFVRWQAMVLIAFTVGKVFLWDSSTLGKGYRIVSFMALGVVLMAVSYVYSRDWLKLTHNSQAE
jgi:uncharacterized membrane protein